MKAGEAVDKRGIKPAAQNHPQLVPSLQAGFATLLDVNKYDLKQQVTIDIPVFSLLQHHRLSRFIHIQEARACQPASLSNQPKG